MTFPFGYVLPILATAQFPENSARSVISWCLQRLDCRRGASLWYWCNLYAFKFGFETVLWSKYAMTTMLLLLLIYIYIITVYYSGSIMGVWFDPFHPLFSAAQRWTSSIIKMHLVKPSTVKNSLAVLWLTWRMAQGSAVRLLRYAKSMLRYAIGVYQCRPSCYIMYWEYQCKPYPVSGCKPRDLRIC